MISAQFIECAKRDTLIDAPRNDNRFPAALERFSVWQLVIRLQLTTHSACVVTEVVTELQDRAADHLASRVTVTEQRAAQTGMHSARDDQLAEQAEQCG